ncbi:hypothetical protein EDB86DRAFT_3079452 [Lactarius hatsudake]|nr:hypothetical protein EDB86DRAFT_3079452 [Lactarius hatsudake]
MSPLLTNYSILSPLKRQCIVRGRSNNATPSPSKCANRLPVLSELSGKQDAFSFSIHLSSVSLSNPFPRISPSVCPSEKPRIRYGRREIAPDQAEISSGRQLSTHPVPNC